MGGKCSCLKAPKIKVVDCRGDNAVHTVVPSYSTDSLGSRCSSPAKHWHSPSSSVTSFHEVCEENSVDTLVPSPRRSRSEFSAGEGSASSRSVGSRSSSRKYSAKSTEACDLPASSQDAATSSRRLGFGMLRVPNSCSSSERSFTASSESIRGSGAEGPAPTLEELSQILDKVLRHSGSLNLVAVKVSAMEGARSMEQACQALPKPDKKMPSFEAKVDVDNLLEQLPPGSVKLSQLALHRVSFMGTEWLAVRLQRGSPEQCLQFCSLAVTLRNLGRSTCRGVAIQARDGRKDMPCLACAPTRGHTALSCPTSWLDIVEDLGELAEIVLTEPAPPRRRLQTELRRWARKPRRLAAEANRRLPGSPGGGRRRRSQSDSCLAVQLAPAGGAPGPHRVASSKAHAARRQSEPGPAPLSAARRGSLRGRTGTPEDQSLAAGALDVRGNSANSAADTGGSVGDRLGQRGVPLPEGAPSLRTRRRSAPDVGLSLADLEASTGAHASRQSEWGVVRRAVRRNSHPMVPILEQGCEDSERVTQASRRHSTGGIEE